MSNFMENGPSNHNGEAEQVWERPWTLEEMQKSSTNWSLAADSGLFLFLQDFSQRMLSKTHEIEKQLDGLIRDTKATDSRLHTVFNDFLMLSNTQFIENRVYDEEVEDPAPKPEAIKKQPEQEKTREQKEAELIPKVQEAVNYGLKVLESAFEQLDIKAGNSDSEDEETLEKVEPILEAKDLYVDRPLPYLIGSQAFMDEDDVGLGDLSSDEMSIGSDRDSVIESDVEEGDEQSDEYSDQDEEVHDNFKKKPSVACYDDADEESEDEDSDIFGGSDKDEDELRKDTGLPSFADELAARIKGETPNKPEADRTSLSSGPPITQKKSKTKKEPKPQVEDDQDEMFKPPKMEDEEYSPFGGKGGLFSGGKGLFDDDEGDLFSDAPKTEPMEKTVTQPAEPLKTKKIPIGAVSIFPGNKLFGLPNDSDSLESKNSKSPVKPKVQAAPKRASVGSGLFDDEDDDDDFFSGKAPNKSTPGQEKQMPKKTVDLFGELDEEEDEYDEGGTMFSGKVSAALSQQDKRAEGEEETRPPEKKPPVGAISMFGPGTKNILEGLKKRRLSTSEESAKSEESGPPPEAVKSSPGLGASEKTHSKSLFSDDEDSQLFASETTSKSKPTTRNKPSKAPLSIFDDEEEEELFSSTPKSKSVQVKKTSLQPKKPVSTSLFSDDEDQWMSSKTSKESPEVKPSGMKSSVSAPSGLPSVKTPQKDGLFDDDDLFAATNESSKKSSQRVSLLFEDEDEDEDKGPLFGFKTPANKTPSEAKVSGAPSQFESTEEENVPNIAKDKIAEEKKSVEKKPVESTPSSDDSTEIKKKPVGAVSLFGGIDVLADRQDTSKKQTKIQEEIADGDELQKEGPPPMESKGTKAKKTALSLFDDDDDDDMNSDEIIPAPKTSKSTEKNALKDHGPRMKSTGVFQDEELLFSHTQQRDNDPDVDLFATSPKPAVASQSSVKPVVPTLFRDDDDDDLFSSAKPKAPPKVPEKPSKPKTNEMAKSTLTSSKESTSPLKSKKTSSRIGDLQASLAVNPASLLPGAVQRIPGAVSVIPGLAPASLPAAAKPLPARDMIPDHRPSSEGGVSFDSPAQVSMLQNANKGRAKGAVRRRPQTKAARHLAAQESEEAVGESTSIQADKLVMAASLPTFNPVSVRPSALTIPVSTPAPDEAVRPKRFLDSGNDLFDSDDLFATKPVPSSKHKAKTPEEGRKKASKTEAIIASKKDQASSIFDSHEDDLFATVKQKPVQKAKQMSFLDDDDDIFGAGSSKSADSKNSKSQVSSAKPDVFKDEVKEPPKAQKKPKEVSLDASLFDDDVDIFADLTSTTKPKEKTAKKKLEAKSIFDDDMDDIFSTGSTKPTVKPSNKSKKNQPAQDPISTVETGNNIFDDPLNAFGGN
ncbi:WASH complex subunit FAM21A-like isoform X1 [Sinocyclocheilus rhinocerous]|uniref:WASH complex subunit FAM21A-like isoform X1 n=1 Tax=Sinocyclocheilus rhinocerous TaxID=307959 RepID=UPI0007B98C54|nr:PREDICTED: WASH complex subunit FAM21A-like isoform X1 [Sinocyclocheilus rhinocerous]